MQSSLVQQRPSHASSHLLATIVFDSIRLTVFCFLHFFCFPARFLSAPSPRWLHFVCVSPVSQTLLSSFSSVSPAASRLLASSELPFWWRKGERVVSLAVACVWHMWRKETNATFSRFVSSIRPDIPLLLFGIPNSGCVCVSTCSIVSLAPRFPAFFQSVFFPSSAIFSFSKPRENPFIFCSFVLIHPETNAILTREKSSCQPISGLLRQTFFLNRLIRSPAFWLFLFELVSALLRMDPIRPETQGVRVFR